MTATPAGTPVGRPRSVGDVATVVAATVAVVAGAREVRRGQLRAAESRCFEVLNGVTDRVRAPVWAVMQLGSLGGAIATGAAVAAGGKARLGGRLAAVGALTWAGSKLVKRFAGRGRPAAVIHVVRVLGREQAGLGYPSGHAGVAVALAAAATPHLPERLRAPVWLAALGIGGSRVYVGAHLPLDVAGGAALGLAVERAARVALGPA